MITEFNVLTRAEANERMAEWIANEGKVLPSLKLDYLTIRREIEGIYFKAKQEMQNKDIRCYEFDVRFGIYLTPYLIRKPWFNRRTAADDGFWRYLAIMVCPHLVAERWGYNNQDHYWTKGTRIWFRTLYWYVFLSWAGSEDATRTMLLDSRFSTDTIMHLVERTSRKGTHIELYRAFFKVYAQLKPSAISMLKKNAKHAGGVFGSMMCLNTAHTVVIEPTFFEGGLEGYVRSLFSELGANSSSYNRKSE